MKIIKIGMAGLVFSFAQASWGAGTPTTMACSDFKPTPEAAARFADLRGACESIVEIDGRTYAKVRAVVRRASSSSVTLNIPATDHTFSLKPDPDRRVMIGNQRVRPRDLTRGQEINIYLPTDTFAEPNVTEVAMVEEENVVPETVIATVEAEPEPALPTTASNLPALLLLGVGLLIGGAVLRRMARV